MKFLRNIALMAFVALCSGTTVSCISGEDIKTNEYEDSIVENRAQKDYLVKIFIEYPENGPKQQVQAIRKWIGSMLDVRQDSALIDGESFVKQFIKNNKFADNVAAVYPLGYTYTVDCRKTSETDRYVTYVIETTQFKSGVRKTIQIDGKTFLKPEGKQLNSAEIFNSQYERQLANVICKGLIEDCQVPDFEGLMQKLGSSCLEPSTQTVLNLPKADPWIEDDVIVFQYQEGEIGPFTAGTPKARIDMDDVEEYFSPSFMKAWKTAARD